MKFVRIFVLGWNTLERPVRLRCFAPFRAEKQQVGLFSLHVLAVLWCRSIKLLYYGILTAFPELIFWNSVPCRILFVFKTRILWCETVLSYLSGFVKTRMSIQLVDLLHIAVKQMCQDCCERETWPSSSLVPKILLLYITYCLAGGKNVQLGTNNLAQKLKPPFRKKIFHYVISFSLVFLCLT